MNTEGGAAVVFNLQQYPEGVRAVFLDAFQDGAEHITDWEQANHRWQNQTGAAEQGLHCTAVYDAGSGALKLVNAHTVPYGVYLETMQEGRFAILLEAIRRHWLVILRDAAERVKGSSGRLRGSRSG